MNLIDIISGEIFFNGIDMPEMSDTGRRQINGRKIAMIFQDPLSHLNPVYTVGFQIVEVMTTHGVSSKESRGITLELMQRVGVPEAETKIDAYPHQFSGGQ